MSKQEGADKSAREEAGMIEKMALDLTHASSLIHHASVCQNQDDTAFALQFVLTGLDELRLTIRAYLNTTESKASRKYRPVGGLSEPPAPILQSPDVQEALRECKQQLIECPAIPATIRDQIVYSIDIFINEPIEAVDLSAWLLGAKERLRSKRCA